MPDILEQLRQKESKIAELQSKEDRRRGREEQLLKQLQTDFNLKTIEEAQVLQKQLQEQKDTCVTKLQDLDTEMAGIITDAQTPAQEVGLCG